MIKLLLLITITNTVMFLSACQSRVNAVKATANSAPTPTAIVAAASADEWRLLDVENTLYMKLSAGGTVVIELLPALAPEHVKNTKALVRQGVFDGTHFYRVIDGFVAQGGPLYESTDDLPQLKAGDYSVVSELTSDYDMGEAYLRFDTNDGYADETGFYRSFAVGRDLSSNESWLLHCYGALGMGRGNNLDSGGTALYVVNGPAQRYLDRNVTVFGRVIDGMEHIQHLKRGQNLSGSVDLTGLNGIESLQVAADIPVSERKMIEVMRSDSTSFKQLLAARKNRTGDWFVHQADYMDACGVPIPTRLQPLE
ncbi:peptidylprolyl isomerase [Marinicella sp. S1101]|uniref:peptidylprolyl isomerase n=1 Tax=Marinicella marina TaxID=2996016 RepID=UPI002260A24A|nr:peptidylprolyl isomerase [Marinicella marina]MCX7554477.1 peptidylprolyl isomerase [Marinicella marina]MDJ1140628.1 peptidylprolyl isomerase [Marinicella marina]